MVARRTKLVFYAHPRTGLMADLPNGDRVPIRSRQFAHGLIDAWMVTETSERKKARP